MAIHYSGNGKLIHHSFAPNPYKSCSHPSPLTSTPNQYLPDHMCYCFPSVLTLLQPQGPPSCSSNCWTFSCLRTFMWFFLLSRPLSSKTVSWQNLPSHTPLSFVLLNIFFHNTSHLGTCHLFYLFIMFIVYYLHYHHWSLASIGRQGGMFYSQSYPKDLEQYLRHSTDSIIFVE